MNYTWSILQWNLAALRTVPILLVLAACGGNGAVKAPPAENKLLVGAFTPTRAKRAAPLEVSVDAIGLTDPKWCFVAEMVAIIRARAPIRLRATYAKMPREAKTP